MKIAFLLVLLAGSDALFKIPSHTTFYAEQDTSLGHPFKTIITQGQFVGLDKKNPNHFFFKDQSSMMTMNLIFGAPEMDCFIANHTGDDLRLTYAIYDHATSDGHERLNYAQRIVSLKSGDDTKTWAEKEQRDSSLLREHHRYLDRLRGGKPY